jgi:hypothetical protein
MNDNGVFCAPSNFFNNASGASVAGPRVQTCTPHGHCSFDNCKSSASFSAPIDWDKNGGRSPGDPTIDIDGLTIGPENLNIAGPSLDGDYLFGAFAYNISADTDTTLRVFVAGTLAREFNVQVAPQEWRELAIVRVRNGVACVEDLTDGNDFNQCP